MMSKKQNTDLIKANHDIKCREVRVVDHGIMNTTAALKLAKESNKDLVLIQDNANPPVCKIIEINKFLYEKKQHEKQQKKKQRLAKTIRKEIRLGLNIEIGDLRTKVQKVKSLLESGAIVDIVVILKGRERSADRQHLAVDVINKFVELSEVQISEISVSNNRVMTTII
jgi:translation initiation factor IF-3